MRQYYQLGLQIGLYWLLFRDKLCILRRSLHCIPKPLSGAFDFQNLILKKYISRAAVQIQMSGKAFKFVRIKEQEVLMVRDELCFPRQSTLYIALHTLFGELSTLRISSRTSRQRQQCFEISFAFFAAFPLSVTFDFQIVLQKLQYLYHLNPRLT